MVGLDKISKAVLDAVIAWGELKYREDSLGRDGEEREWQEAGLFYQRRQWLEWRDAQRTYVPIQQDKNKPRPMPVSNYFAKTINANANNLQLVRVTATPKNDDPQTRRAADYAEMAKNVLDQETNLRLLVPLLAKHTALWGMGVMKDEIDTSEDPQQLEVMGLGRDENVGCLECGYNGITENKLEPDEDYEPRYQEEQCPQCGSSNTVTWNRDYAQSVESYRSGKGKIRTSIVPLFEVFLPRGVQNANLTPRLIHRYRRPVSKVKQIFGDAARDVKADSTAESKSESRMDLLRSLTNYTYADKSGADDTTLTEVWAKWTELPERIQERIEEAFEQEPEEEPEDEMGEPLDPEELMKMKLYGLYFIYCNGMMLEFGANPHFDDDNNECFFPFTFTLWELDPMSSYPKGIGADLIPLQKRLNRLDSLIELAMMNNAVGKWLWPNTQKSNRPPSGDPSEVVEYDTLGDGKVKPEFIAPQPFSGQVWQLRAAILQDFQQLGLSLGVQQGQASSQAAFRTVAYLGAKASEQLNTQRYLWESAHCLHYKKLLSMAKYAWDEERQAKVSGPNGAIMWENFSGDALKGMYELDFVPDSSIPKTLDEKMAMIQQLVAGQLVDLNDPTNRQYLYDTINLEGLNLASEIQFRKAERDLEAVKRGEMPTESPYQDWNIALKITANFTLTEEFEALNPQLQGYVLAYAEYINQKMIAINQQSMMQQQMQQMGPQVASAAMSAADADNKKLAKIPGVTAATGDVETAAADQGNNFAEQMA